MNSGGSFGTIRTMASVRRTSASSCDPSAGAACNRLPFVSDDSCYRGEVDTGKFDALPYCSAIDPIEASVPPELRSTTMVMQIPPPCTCIDISRYEINVDYVPNGSSAGGSGSMWASGDCCEGNYVERLDIRIPCPVVPLGHSPKISVHIGYGSGPSAASASYASADSSCNLELKDAPLDLKIPFIFADTAENQPTIKANVAFGDGEPDEQQFADIDQTNFTASVNSVELNLSVPCPIKNARLGHVDPPSGPDAPDDPTPPRDPTAPRDPRISLSMKWNRHKRWGMDSSSTSASYASFSSCDVALKDAKLRLEIPCPVKTVGTSTITATTHFMDEGELPYDHGSFAFADPDDCDLSLRNVTLDIPVPCPAFSVTRGRVQYTSSSAGDIVIESSSDSGGCGKKYTVNITFPTRTGRYMEPFEYTECCVESGDFYFDGQLQHVAGVCADDGSVYIVCTGTPVSTSSSGTEYQWAFAMSTTEGVAPGGGKVLNVKLYDLAGCKVTKDYRGANLPVISGGKVFSSIEDVGVFVPVYNNGMVRWFKNQYYQVGGFTFSGPDTGYELPASFSGIVALRMCADSSLGGIGCSADIVTYADYDAMVAVQTNLSYVIIPLYEVRLGKIVIDFRRMPNTGMLEFYPGPWSWLS